MRHPRDLETMVGEFVAWLLLCAAIFLLFSLGAMVSK
jgi:hypothetical protein